MATPQPSEEAMAHRQSRSQIAAFFRASTSAGDPRYLEALKSRVPVRHAIPARMLHFANDCTTTRPEEFDPEGRFRIGRYLAQRFPPLRNTTSLPFGPTFRLPKGLDLTSRDEDSLRRLVDAAADPIPYAEGMTVRDALAKLDERVLALLQEWLPATLVRYLAAWLRQQWAGYRALLPSLDRLRAEEELLSKAGPLVPNEGKNPIERALAWVKARQSVYAANVSDEAEFWERYFWSFVSVFSDTAIEVGGLRLVAPPLVGRIEAFASRRIEMGEEGAGEWFVSQWEHFSCSSCQATLDRACGVRQDSANLSDQDRANLGDRLREGRCTHFDAEQGTDERVIHPVHLCDRLGDAFLEWACCPPALRMTPELDDGGTNLVGLTRNDEPCLWVYYYGPGGVSGWLGEGATPGGPQLLNPRDHWALRAIEVEQPQASYQISLMLPARTFRGLAALPQACAALLSGGRAVAESSGRLEEPVWLNEATIVEFHLQALRASGQGNSRAYRDFEREFQSLASPILAARRAARSSLLERTQPLWHHSLSLQMAQAAPFPEVAAAAQRLHECLAVPEGLPQADWQMVSQLLAEIGRMHEHQAVERQQQLADLHRRLAAVLEMVALVRFQENKFPMNGGRTIQDLFRGWLRKAEPDVDQWDPPQGKGKSVFYHDILAPAFGPLKTVGGSASATPLVDLIDQTVDNARRTRSRLQLARLGNGIKLLLDAEPGTTNWLEALGALSVPSRDGVAELLLGGKLLFEIRNFLTHGIVPEQGVDEAMVEVEHAGSGCRVRLDTASLDYCFRLTVGVAHATWSRLL